jgi:hypothetical protein
MLFKIVKRLKKIGISIQGNYLGINSQKYWDLRFNSNWELQNGKIQTMLFAAGFISSKFAKTITPLKILDYGCGLGDSIPILRMAFPESEISFYDFSNVAMEKAKKEYSDLAKPLDLKSPKKYELVYCSNVIEHITDSGLIEFVNLLTKFSSKHVVIQAPFDERLPDGSKISPLAKSNEIEHERTIDSTFIGFLAEKWPQYKWTEETMKIPRAWDMGLQIFFIGTKLHATS